MLDKFDDPDIFTKLTDEVVQKLRNSKNEDVKRIFHRIDTRQLYKCIDENKVRVSRGKTLTLVMQILSVAL